jgi:hypothetical protein
MEKEPHAKARETEVDMLVITGIFENERFISDSPVSIPQKKGYRNDRRRYESANKWRKIGEAILNCNEELPGNPQPVQFRSIAEMY